MVMFNSYVLSLQVVIFDRRSGQQNGPRLDLQPIRRTRNPVGFVDFSEACQPYDVHKSLHLLSEAFAFEPPPVSVGQRFE